MALLYFWIKQSHIIKLTVKFPWANELLTSPSLQSQIQKQPSKNSDKHSVYICSGRAVNDLRMQRALNVTKDISVS